MNLKDKFTLETYTFKHYCSLTYDEKCLVLESRNKNKKWMLQQDEITLESHLKWIDSLKNDDTKLNYLVYKDNIPFIAISYHDIDEKEAYWGYFLINENYKSEVLKIEKIIIELAFEHLSLDRLLCINDSKNHVIKIHEFFGFKILRKEIHNNQEYTVMSLEKEKK
ncbi:hypothetical protein CP965_07400 [Halarcobacter mediterraneus]|uniref:UDP-4-amino-4, 6-dideoxy-N-acetyl-beta-L-altrosamine N-acetyltransferase n=1 Tax=Halarcobacter mediterraneus TaxID=2023153 RepID=A0A4V1M1G8_9BACT|nr:hypothetical protein [Halarcobacter mediterraneus]RXK13614.1 hypothetical protein CP965_07400 [Halarcobacter mediterraneus]